MGRGREENHLDSPVSCKDIIMSQTVLKAAPRSAGAVSEPSCAFSRAAPVLGLSFRKMVARERRYRLARRQGRNQSIHTAAERFKESFVNEL